MSSRRSHSAVKASASNTSSQAKASPRTESQRRQASTAGMAEGEVMSKAPAAICRWLKSDVGIAVMTCVVGSVSLLADGFWGTVAAIVINAAALVVLLWVWRRASGGAR